MFLLLCALNIDFELNTFALTPQNARKVYYGEFQRIFSWILKEEYLKIVHFKSLLGGCYFLVNKRETRKLV